MPKLEKTIIIKTQTKGAQESLTALKKGVKGVGDGAKGSQASILGMTLSTKALGLALKSAGIGIVISALVGLGNALMQNQKIMDTFNTGLEMFNLTFKRIISFYMDSINLLQENEKFMAFFQSRVENLGNIFNNTLNFALNNFNMGMKTASVLWNASPFGDGSTSLNDLKNLGSEMLDFAGTQTGILKDQLGEFKTFAKDQVDGIGVSFDFAKDRFSDLQEEFITGEDNIYNTSKAIVSLRNEVKLADAEQRQLQLTYQKDAEIQRQIRDDVSLTIQERQEANTRLGEILDEQTKAERSAMLKSLELAQLELDQDESNIDLQVALINAKTELIDLDERIAGQRSEQLVNTNSLLKEEQDLLKQIAEQKKKDAKAEEEEEEDIKNAKIKAAKDILKATTTIAGESSKVGKAAAVSNILIDTALAISGAVKSAQTVGFPGNLVAITTGIATVMANIRTAKGILAKAGAGDGGDVSVGAVGGTPAMGGIGGTIPNINSISPDADMQPVQAFVIENEISDAQALQEELEIQATL